MSLLSKPRRVAEIARFKWVQRSGNLIAPEEPHLDEEGGQEFRRLLSSAAFYAEFGCGGSTVLASRRGIPVVSVESDQYFASAVRRKLPRDHSVELVHANIGSTVEWGFPLRRKPTQHWRRYIEAMHEAIQRRGRSPDLAMVDGRFRVACALYLAHQAAELDAPIVVFFDDYTDRSYYHEIEHTLGKPKTFGRAARFDLLTPVRGITQKQVHDALVDPR